ncbi:DNA-directed RNA polymerases II, IV and V subunit 9B [Dionaea muscipula]
MSTMKFCPKCNNILYPKEERETRTLYYACRSCDHRERTADYCVYRNEIHHSVGERTQVLQDVATDPTLPRTKSQCPQCNHGKAAYFQVILSLFFVHEHMTF